MREILFRGKRYYDGSWVEGYLIHDETCNTHIPYIGYLIDGGHDIDVAEIILGTVGQFTGLTDKNGKKKIFEGDVVKAVIARDWGGGTENREETGIIWYNKIGMIGLIAKYAGTIPVWSDFFQELTLSGCIDDFWFEIIGNIHDNPELLEVSDGNS